MIGRWAPSEALATAAGATSPVSNRYGAPGRAAGIWAAMWLLTGAAAFGALVPVIFARDAPVVAADLVPRAVELAVYFVTCEALANVGKYARATAASVRVSRTATGLSVEIADDGMVARTPPEAPACTAWPTASRRSTGICA